MRLNAICGLFLVVLLAWPMAGCARVPELPQDPEAFAEASPTPQVTLQASPVPASPAPVGTPMAEAPASVGDGGEYAYELVSQERLFNFMDDLTAIQPYSGWRNSATEGEAEALDYVAETLGGMDYLQGLGLELERQEFRVFLATELWESTLYLTIGGQEVVVPADAPRGDRNTVDLALMFDSDGEANDAERDPVTVDGQVVVVAAAGGVSRLDRAAVRNAVVLLNYAVVDPVLQGQARASQLAQQVLSMRPAAIVLITEFSNERGKSHGTFVGEGGVFRYGASEGSGIVPPILYARLEDLRPAGIGSWEDLSQVERARLVWDADVFWPGTSGNLVAHIPGQDSSRAVILGAHIDSPNSPGAMDDGSGSVVLLEVARVLDAAQIQPSTDVYLVWFGSEEIGLYGSAHFAATHQELLDRTVGLLQIDMLSHPLDGIPARLELVAWSHGRFGKRDLPWPERLAVVGAQHGVSAEPVNEYTFYSDNAAVAGFDVPNADLIYAGPGMANPGPIHYGAHIHDPYDTSELAREEGETLAQMARLALAAALDGGREPAQLRISPPAGQRAVFVASHTEALQMSPVSFVELGMALALAGFDVDMVPYGQAVTEADLVDAGLVVALPVVDFPAGATTLYDEAWREDELVVLTQYVERGGLLVLANSAYRLDLGGRPWDYNEDWSDVNALAQRFGVSYNGTLGAVQARVVSEHGLVAGLRAVELSESNALGFTVNGGQVLAEADGRPAVALVDHGEAGGQVLVMADLGLLGQGWSNGLKFWQNLAAYVGDR